MGDLLNSNDFTDNSVKDNAELYIANRINDAIEHANLAEKNLKIYLKDINTAAEGLSYADIGLSTIEAQNSTPNVLTSTAPVFTNSVDINTNLDLDLLEFVPLPSFGGISTIPEAPSNTDQPSTEILFFEQNYISSLLDSLKDRLQNDINGGSGLSAEVEQAMYDRDRIRREREADSAIYTTMEFFAGRGFGLPTGAMNSSIQKTINEKNVALADHSNDILIRAAEMEQQARAVTLQNTNALEATLIDLQNKINDRSLDKEKSSISLAIESWKLTWDRYQALVDAVKIEADIMKAEIESSAAYNNAVASMNVSNIDVEKSKAELKIKQLDAEIEGFKGEVAAFEGAIRAYEVKESTRIENDKSINSVNIANAELAIKASEASIQSIIAIKSILLESAKSGANISAQIIASALQSINAGVSYGYAGSYSSSHRYDETKQENEGMSVLYREEHSFKHPESQVEDSSLIDTDGNTQYNPKVM